MARTNVPNVIPNPTTYEGAVTVRSTPERELRRAALTALLFEDSFYETGDAAAERIAALVHACDPLYVASLAVEARHKMYLRHLPLFLVRELARKGNGSLVAATLPQVIRRPDELCEYLAIYWRGADKDAPLSAGSKRGLSQAFTRFKEETLGKWDKDNAIKLRDVLRVIHARPKDGVRARLPFDPKINVSRLTFPYRASTTSGQGEVWARVISRKLAKPVRWESELSAGKDKRATFEMLLRDGKISGYAFLKNLRNMIEAGVDDALIRARFEGEFEYVLPFRFISAAVHAPQLEDVIEQAMIRVCENLPRFTGHTALVVDTSPSMIDYKISEKSEMTRLDAAAALAILARSLCERVSVWAFNEKAYEVKPRKGFALRDELLATVGSYSCGGLAVAAANARGYDRIIVLTDGQWHVMGHHRMVEHFGKANDIAPDPLTNKAYMVNIAPEKNGYTTGRYHNVDGWSEQILDFIFAVESENVG